MNAHGWLAEQVRAEYRDRWMSLVDEAFPTADSSKAAK
jgi:hypothetical protein